KHMSDLYKQIEKERDKLTRLVSQAAKRNQPIGNDVILAQNRKLSLLFGKLENQRNIGQN
ncbi:MAG TPA: hypothetical protein VN366_09560, partial [Feifaniaceae bacterium]|nr:hypothetical protein [Feifaniaceae bacterium]